MTEGTQHAREYSSVKLKKKFFLMQTNKKKPWRDRLHSWGIHEVEHGAEFLTTLSMGVVNFIFGFMIDVTKPIQ